MPFYGLVNGAGPLSHGEYTVTSGDVSGGGSAIATGLTSIDTCHVQVIRSNKVATSDATITYSGGTITVASGSTYTLTAGDILRYIAIGE